MYSFHHFQLAIRTCQTELSSLPTTFSTICVSPDVPSIMGAIIGDDLLILLTSFPKSLRLVASYSFLPMHFSYFPDRCIFVMIFKPPCFSFISPFIAFLLIFSYSSSRGRPTCIVCSQPIASAKKMLDVSREMLHEAFHPVTQPMSS